MKFTLNWLKEYLDTDKDLDEILHWLTMVGLEVESVEDRAKLLKEFVVGHVLEAKQHPDADRLQVLQVDNGIETLEVVCGAPNARTGLKGVFAGNGSYIPGIDVTLKTTKIRGVTSNGMMLSEREIGLSDDHEGIIEVAEDAEVGSAAAEALGMTDPVIDIAITPNRGDCLGIFGVARDLAAAGVGSLKPLDVPTIKGSFTSPISVSLDFDDDHKTACPMFAGRYIKGVKNGESPKWLKDKLLAIGLRPISALVDITNYMTIAHCRPLHVFDADKIKGNINVRMAKEGEKMLALDGKEYEMDGEMTVIADDQDAEALAGVMGGERTGVSEATVNVMLETAYFDPGRTAMTGRKLNLQSDARFRFERGVDPAFLEDATEIATQLILDLCGGEASELIVAGSEPEWKRSYFLRDTRVKELGGVEVAPDRTQEILEILGFDVTKSDGGWDTIAPSWRYDVVGEADLVEEVLRINGFDEIPIVPLERETALPHGAINLIQDRRSRVRRSLATRGMTEAVTFSFVAPNQADLFGGVPESIHLVNPISTDLAIMRPSILPNLIAAAGRNADRGISDVALFELGPQFAGENPDDETIVAAGLRVGSATPRNWAGKAREVDVFDVKADVLAALEQIGGPAANAQIAQGGPQWYHPGRSGTVQLGPKSQLAHFGEIHPAILKAMDVEGPVVGFEIYLDNAPMPKAGKGATRSKLDLHELQAVERDFAFIVEDKVSAEDLVRSAASADKKLIADVTVFDVFTGGNLDAHQMSVGLSVTLQPTEATLTDAEIEAVSDKVVANVAKQTGGILRG
ncbi:MAG: phenylalanine--tRNA ligase subunit beta [Rhodospirillaceae bacterium]|jgi:phenylalanyl-tRNA synthetase beta chain|nr:phenylalanine--tRNA ligase subunit beta [Rhodospirillaceae bacterium]MBT7956618.1 phenylalanine--tRNA ligase subunit beta [Rhodospirillaceae bacterium]